MRNASRAEAQSATRVRRDDEHGGHHARRVDVDRPDEYRRPRAGDRRSPHGHQHAARRQRGGRHLEEQRRRGQLAVHRRLHGQSGRQHDPLPSGRSRARVFAATGEGFFNQDAIRGAGIFVSSDEGETWAQLPSTANVNFDFVNRIAFSADGSILVAATRTGLFRSLDLGGSWTQVLAQADMMDVKFIAGSSAQAVASGRNRNAYFSANGGQTWSPSAGLVPGGSGFRIELAVSRSSPNIVYASLDENSGQIWKSSDSGASYQLISSPAHLSTQGWYDNAIWVDPTNPDHVVAGGVSLFRSTNGGVGFTSVSSCHVDQHAIVERSGLQRHDEPAGVLRERRRRLQDGGRDGERRHEPAERTWHHAVLRRRAASGFRPGDGRHAGQRHVDLHHARRDRTRGRRSSDRTAGLRPSIRRIRTICTARSRTSASTAA